MYLYVVNENTLAPEVRDEIAQKIDVIEESRHHNYIEWRAQVELSHAELDNLRARFKLDINAIPETLHRDDIRLVISDMDSTFINIECVDEIADFAGKKKEVSAITEAAMRGELDFAQSLTRRVGLLAGLDVSVLQTVYDERLRLNPGAELMLKYLHANNIKFALVSGGFTFFTSRLKERYGLDFAHANVLEVNGNKLAGRIQGAIVGAEAKKSFLEQCCEEMGIQAEQTVAVGDGANDLKMMAHAGMGVAYHAKPKVQAEAACSLNYSGLEGILPLLGIDYTANEV